MDDLVSQYEVLDFIPNDPISIPHGFDDKDDIEIIGLYAALLAWGRRATIMNKMAELCERMSFRPAEFVRNFDSVRDADALTGFKHRTFQPADALAFTKSLSVALKKHGSVEKIFASFISPNDLDVGPAIQGFSETIMTILPDTPARLQKHLARPNAGSACKRINMYLRWMVRPGPVDFDLWKKIKPAQLVLPLDVHSGRAGRQLGLLTRKQNDWKSAVELTASCQKLDPNDPSKYDFALFGPGAAGASFNEQFVVDEE